jgi:hypothetical protein
MIEPLDESGAPVICEPLAGRADDAQLEQRIRVRAYERYLERQGRPGSPETDWAEAEREVRSASWSPRESNGGPAAI